MALDASPPLTRAVEPVHELDPWPELPLSAWRDTRATLHMFTQVVGKIRLTLALPEPQWANVPLYVTVTGLTTGPMPYGVELLQIDIDLADHRLVAHASGAAEVSFPLTSRSVADFYDDLMAALRHLGVDVRVNPVPSEVPDPVPFPDDTRHASYDPVWASRFHQALASVDRVFKAHRAPFAGRHTPVHFFWGTFDLAYTRYSGRPATPPLGVGSIERKAMDAECVNCGFWPGDDAHPSPAFFCYAYPKPDGLEAAAVRPDGAGWDAAMGEFLLPYEVVRRSPCPDCAILGFLRTSYRAAADRGGWPEPTR